MYRPLVAEILTIGDELCRGEIVDSNSAWMAEKLTGLGLHVRWKSSTTDDTEDMKDALLRAAGRARVVLCSGGLGPTEDDRTVDVLSALLDVEPVVDAPHMEKMKARFAERGFELTQNNLRQVRVPSGSDVLTNRAGLAPGFHARLTPADFFFTPGVPREMKRIFDDEIGPRLVEILRAAGADAAATAQRAWRVTGLGESHVDHRLRGILDGPPRIEGATIHFRIAYPETVVTVVVRRETQAAADAVLGRIDREVRARLGEHVYGEGEDSLPSVVGRELLAQGATLATAESCTGGLISDLLTDVPGSSAYYLGGVVCYSDALKQSLLGVRAETLAAHGAVSEACVREMAAGARRATGARFAIAVSGIAGPSGGTPEKPVGMVHFAVAGPGGEGDVEARVLTWPTERRMVKQLAAAAALFLLYRRLRREEGPAATPAAPPAGLKEPS